MWYFGFQSCYYFLRFGIDGLSGHEFDEGDHLLQVQDFFIPVRVEVGAELLCSEETYVSVELPFPQPDFLMDSMMMSKRYLKGGLSRSFSVILGLSIHPENKSLVGFQKSPIRFK